MSHSARQKWDARYRAREDGPAPAPGWLAEIEEEIPRSGRALDIAAGTGRVSLWLARRGLEVMAADISPVGLAIAREAASAEGLPLETQVVDFERDAFPEGPFDVIACFNYHQPALFPAIMEALAPRGVALVEVATAKNLERNAHPSRRWLAAEGEVRAALSELDVVHYEEDWFDERHVVRACFKKV